jgi:PAS domain S-box-containing protein
MKLSKPVKIHVGLVIATGSVVIFFSLFKSGVYSSGTIIAAAIFFILLGAIAESLPVRLEGENLLSISSTVSIAAILLFDVHTAVLVRFLGAILAVRKTPTRYTHLFNTEAYKSLFNGSVRGIAVLLAGLTYQNLSVLIPDYAFLEFNVVGLLGLVVVYFTVDVILYAILFTLLTKSKFRDEINKKLWTFTHLVLLAPIGVLFAGLYNWQGIIPIIFFFGPFLFTRNAIEQAYNRHEIQNKTQAELRTSEEKFSKAFHASPMAIVIQRVSDLRYVDINEGFTRITGYSREEAREHTINELGLYPDNQISAKMGKQLREQGFVRDFEIPFRRKNGEIGFGLVWSEPIEINGEAMYIAGTLDITERKQAEILQAEQAQEITALYDALARITSAPEDVKSLTELIATIVVNDFRAHECSVWLLSEDHSRVVRSAYVGDAILDHADFIPMDVSGMITSAVRTGESLYAPDVRIDPLYRMGDEKTLSEFVVPLQTYGEVIGVINMESPNLDGFNERTRRLVLAFAKNAAIALQNTKLVNSLESSIADLKETQARINFFLEHTAEGVYRIDFDPPIPTDLPFEEQFKLSIERGKIGECNDAIARMYGFPSRKEMLGTPYVHFYGEGGYETNLESNLDFYRQGYKVDGIETEELSITGEKVYFINNVVGIIRDDYFVATWGTQRDITPLKKAFAELEARNAELERFNYTLSHELKTPLVTMRGFLGYLENSITTGKIERAKADLARIGNATDKLYKMINELLELSRIGRLINPPQDVPFEDIVREGLKTVDVAISSKNVQVEIAPSLPVIHVDRARLIEVIQNLVDNAIKYLGDQPEPRIIIGVRSENNEQVFFVSDNGMGIDPVYHARVFNLFEKLNPQSEGTGIGLALVKRIIETHGGRIWVESEGVGRGTAFCFTLPREQAK